MDEDPDRGAGGVGFAVGVDEAGGGAFDDKARALKAANMGAPVEPAAEEPGGEGRRTEKSDGTDGDQIEGAVVRAGARRDAGVVAVLVGVRHGHEDDVEGLPPVGGRNEDAFRAQIAKGGERGAGVGGKSAGGEGVEAAAHVGIEPEAHGVEEGMAVGAPRIDLGNTSADAGDEVEGGQQGRRHAEMQREAVARAAGDEREGGRSVEEGLGDFVHRAVAANGDDGRAAGQRGVAGEVRGMAGTIGGRDNGVEVTR